MKNIRCPKDFLGSLRMLQDYKLNYNNMVSLRQSANSIRRMILSCSGDTIDIIKFSEPYPKWKKLKK